jgi:hypothetical protein
MANDVSANPMILDSAGSTVLWPTKVKVASFVFANYSSQASAAIIQGTDGKIKWSATGDPGLEPVSSHKAGWINGLVLSTLDDGQVLVYVE